MRSSANIADDYRRIERALQYIEANFKDQPTLDQIAQSVHLSKYHFDRLFKRWAGITPMQFLQFITLSYTKQKLAESRSVLDTAYDAGLSGPSRLHDLFVTFEAITPGEFKSQGAGLAITYGFAPTPFGECLLATTPRGICHLTFVEPEGRRSAVNELKQSWRVAEFREDSIEAGSLAGKIFDTMRGGGEQPLNLLVKGTNFQTKVWQALLQIPDGHLSSYGDIAAFIGNPNAVRAVANATANNPIAYLIPCHRVIVRSGKIHQYRWGSVRKKAIVGWEAARTIHAE